MVRGLDRIDVLDLTENTINQHKSFPKKTTSNSGQGCPTEEVATEIQPNTIQPHIIYK